MFTFLLIATIFVGSIEGRLEYGAPTNSDVIAAREGLVVRCGRGISEAVRMVAVSCAWQMGKQNNVSSGVERIVWCSHIL